MINFREMSLNDSLKFVTDWAYLNHAKVSTSMKSKLLIALQYKQVYICVINKKLRIVALDTIHKPTLDALQWQIGFSDFALVTAAIVITEGNLTVLRKCSTQKANKYAETTNFSSRKHYEEIRETKRIFEGGKHRRGAKKAKGGGFERTNMANERMNYMRGAW